MKTELKKDDWVALGFSLHRNSSNRFLSPLECSNLLSIAKNEYTVNEIFKRIKISRDMYRKILQLEKIKPKKIRDSIIWGRSQHNLGLLSMSVAKYIAQLEDENNQLELYNLVCKNRLNKSEIKDVIPEFNRGVSLSNSVKNVVSLRPKIIKTNQIIGKIMNQDLSLILIDKNPKERNIIFKNYLNEIISKGNIIKCVLNDKNFFIECSDDVAKRILKLAPDIETFLSNKLLELFSND